MRPGVSASAFLSYTIDENTKEEVTIPAGSRVQSIPGPDELPQTFESSEDLKARSGWNNLRPRMTRPQTAATIKYGDLDSSVIGPRVYLKGIATNLKANDPLLIDFDMYDLDGKKISPEFHTVKEVKLDAAADRTLVMLTLPDYALVIKLSGNVQLIIPLPKDGGGDWLAHFLRPDDQILINFDGVSLSNPHELIVEDIEPDELRPDRRLIVLEPEVEIESPPKNKLLLIDFGIGTGGLKYHITSVNHLEEQNIYTLHLQEERPEEFFWTNSTAKSKLTPLLSDLISPPSIPPSSSKKMTRNMSEVFGDNMRDQLDVKKKPQLQFSKIGAAEVNHALMKAFSLKLGDTLTPSLANAEVTPGNKITVYTLKKKAAPFGHNLTLPDNQGECIPNASTVVFDTPYPVDLHIIDYGEDNKKLKLLALDAEYKDILSNTWVVVERNDMLSPRILKVNNSYTKTLGGIQQGDLSFFSTCPPVTYLRGGLASVGTPIKMRSTVLNLNENWREEDDTRQILQDTTIYAQSEKLTLAEEPVEKLVSGDLIELDSFYEDLESGRSVIVSGEREIKGTSGVRFSELSMLNSVTQDTKKIDGEEGAEEKIHTFIKLAGVTFDDDSASTLPGNSSWPAGMTVSGDQFVGYSGCGEVSASKPLPLPTDTISNGTTALSFSNISIAGYGTCTIELDVTVAADGTYKNTTSHLLINGSTDTGSYGEDSLTVVSGPPGATG